MAPKTSTPSAAATQSSPPTESPTTASAAKGGAGTYSGSADLVSDEGYQAKETFSVSVSTPVSDVTDAPPGYADIKLQITNIQEQFSNQTPGRALPLTATGMPGSQVALLFPAHSPVCKGESSFNSPLYDFDDPNAPVVPTDDSVGGAGCEVPIALLSGFGSPTDAVPPGGSAALSVAGLSAPKISLRYKESDVQAALTAMTSPKYVAHSVQLRNGWKHSSSSAITLRQAGRPFSLLATAASEPFSLNMFGQ